MGRRLRFKHGLRFRDAIVVLTTLSQLIGTIGIPLPSPGRNSKYSSRPFPCQSRPCGCLTADECWNGDCCCFTIEEKLVWAEANGIDPPDHVRPLVESRKSRPTLPKKKSCCAESESPPKPSVTAEPKCCKKKNTADTWCVERSICQAGQAVECPHCSARSKSDCCEKTKKIENRSGVHWVVGIYAQKCRGQGPMGLYQHDPAIVPHESTLLLFEPVSRDEIPLSSERLSFISHRPPTPPPRSS